MLEVLFRMAMTVGKKVKSNLQMSTANTSAIEHAVEHLKRQGFSFAGKECLVIGNGEMGRRSALAPGSGGGPCDGDGAPVPQRHGGDPGGLRPD